MVDMSMPALREMATKMGDRHRSEMRQLLADLEQFKGDERLLARHHLAQLQADNFLSPTEAELLGQVVDVLHDNTALADTVTQVEAIHRQIIADRNASPVAIGIASIGLDSITSAAENGPNRDGGAGGGIIVFKDDKEGKGVSAIDLTGAVAGANIGKAGGFWGALIGGVALGVGASYLAMKDKEKKE